MHKIMLLSMLISCVFLVSAALPAAGKLRLPPIISDGMVLQRDLPTTIWGMAGPCETVTVTIADQTVETVAGKDGKWIVKLKPMPAGGPFKLVVAARETITVKNVLVGEVWLCSGQSNMQWNMERLPNALQQMALVNNPNIRVFTAAWTGALEPQEELAGNWSVATPANAPRFSAVGYFLARELQKELQVPVAIINSSLGGTCIESWMSREVLAADPDGKQQLAFWDARNAKYADAKTNFNIYMHNYWTTLIANYEAQNLWQVAADEARTSGKPEPPAPTPAPLPDIGDINTVTCLYNGMIAPLANYGIRGAAWYQGENNAYAPAIYRKFLPAMITDWRQQWHQGDFPFLVVQLPNYLAPQTEPVEVGTWADFREAQLSVLSVPNTAVAVTIDLGEANDIHPGNKAPVGARLAKAALHVAYHRKGAYSGPLYKSMKVVDNKIVLSFDHVEGGLVVKGDVLKGFAIAGADRKFVWAQAEIKDDTVVVWADSISQPVAVRYGWAHNPPCNLYNRADLPASPFRTDNW
jgi:sialate O-acetylesterase